MATLHEETQSPGLRSLLAILWRRKYLIIGAALIGTLAMGLNSASKQAQYQAVASIVYQKQSDVSSALSGSGGATTFTDVQQELTTMAKLIGSPDMATRAGKQPSVTAGEVLGDVSATVVPDTSMINIGATRADPEEAARVANAYAQAFIDWRRQVQVDQLSQAETIVTEKLKGFATPAQKQTPNYYILLQRLEDLRVLKAMQTGNYQLAQQATIPYSPISPKPRRDAILGFIMGLAVGLGLAFVAEQLDIRVRDQDDMVAALRMPVIGRIPEVPRTVVRSGDLTVVAEPDGLSAEAFRILRGNLDFVNVDHNVRSFLVTSCTSGEGKSSTVSNLAVMLARSGREVAVVECDLRRPKIHRYFRLVNDVGLSDVLTGHATLDEALKRVMLDAMGNQTGGNGSEPPAAGATAFPGGVSVLTSGPLPPNPGEIVLTERLGQTISELDERFDIVLVDSPPFLAIGDAGSLATHVDGIVVVMKIDHITKAMLRDAREFLGTVACAKLGIVVTNASHETRGVYRHRYYSRPISDLGESASEAAAADEPVVGETADDTVAAATGDEADEAEPVTTT